MAALNSCARINPRNMLQVRASALGVHSRRLDLILALLNNTIDKDVEYLITDDTIYG